MSLIIILGLIAFLVIRSGSSHSREYQTKIKIIWRQVVRDSSKIISKAKQIKDKPDLNSFADDIDDFTNSAKEHKSDLEDLEVPQEFDKAHWKLVDSFDELDSYLEGVYSLISKDAEQLKLKNFVPVTKAGMNAKKSFDLALVDLEFLDNLPSGLFNMNARIKPIYKSVWKNIKDNKLKAAQLAKAAEEKRKAELLKQQQLQQQVNQQNQQKQSINQAESVVRNFLSAYISSSNTSRMRSYLSGEALNQFKPDIEFQGDFDRVGYSVVSRELTPLKNYRFYVHIKSKDWEGVYFSDKYKFVVGKVGSSYKIIRRQYVDRVN